MSDFMSILQNYPTGEILTIGYVLGILTANFILIFFNFIKFLINRIAPVQINGGK